MNLLRIALAALALASIAPGASAQAQSYPGKAVRMVVPFPAGGSVDTVARWVSQKLNEAWKQPVIVENRAGAGGTVGADAVAKSAADGHTMLLTTPGLAISPSIYRSLPFNPAADFAPVSQLTSTYLILVVHPSVPAKSVKELINLAKAQPGKLNYGSSGSGATPHLATELFKIMTGSDIVHVPYKGEAPAYAALMANEVQLALGPVSGLLPHIKAGRIRALGISRSGRADALADVPTIAEAGVPGYDVATWWGVLAPGKTPAPVVNRLNEEIRRIVASGDVKARIVADGAEPVVDMPATQFNALLKSDIEKWRRIVKERNIKTN